MRAYLDAYNDTCATFRMTIRHRDGFNERLCSRQQLRTAMTEFGLSNAECEPIALHAGAISTINVSVIEHQAIPRLSSIAVRPGINRVSR